MHRIRLFPLGLAAACLLGGARDAEARYYGNLNLFVGQKWMTEREWTPVDEQRELGLMLAFGEERVSVHFAVDAYYSKKDVVSTDPTVDTRVKGTSGEIAIGVRKVWDLGSTRPYLGGGASAITVREDFEGPSGPVTQSNRGYGAYIQAGIFWRLAGHLNLGIDTRYSKADVDLTGPFGTRDTEAGGFHAGLLLGYGW